MTDNDIDVACVKIFDGISCRRFLINQAKIEHSAPFGNAAGNKRIITQYPVVQTVKLILVNKQPGAV